MTGGSTARNADALRGDLGRRLREVRVARGISLRELAHRAGCSASLVSQVERGMTAPSAGVVYSLANELGISLDFLFGTGKVEQADLPRLPHHNGAPVDHPSPVEHGDTTLRAAAHPWGRASGPNGSGIVQRSGERHAIDLSTGVRWERLTPTHDSRVDFIEVVYEPSGQSSEGGRAIRHDGREYLYVLHGELEATVGFEMLRLLQGDSLAFDPETPHHYRNPTTGNVRVLSVVVHDL